MVFNLIKGVFNALCMFINLCVLKNNSLRQKSEKGGKMLLAINATNGIGSVNKVKATKSYQTQNTIKTGEGDVFEKGAPSFKSISCSKYLQYVNTPNYLHPTHITAAKGSLNKNLNSWEKDLHRAIGARDKSGSGLLNVITLGAFSLLDVASMRSSVKDMIENIEVIQPKIKDMQHNEKVANSIRKSSRGISSAKERLANSDYVENTPIAALNDLLTVAGHRGFELDWDYSKKDYETAKDFLNKYNAKDSSYSNKIDKALFYLNEFWTVPNYKLNNWLIDNIQRWESEINWD